MKPRKRSRATGALPFVNPEFAEMMFAGRRREGGVRRENRQQHHKTLQLCRQAQRALSLALAGECDDDLLRSLYVESVVPAPDASRLRSPCSALARRHSRRLWRRGCRRNACDA